MEDLSQEQLRQFARLGAQARLAQIDAERRAIVGAFPDLSGPRKPGRPPRAAAAKTSPEEARPRRQYRMSPQARQAAADRMRKYWAAKREAKEQKATAHDRQTRSPRTARKRGKR